MSLLGDSTTRKLELPKPGEALPGRDRAIPDRGETLTSP